MHAKVSFLPNLVLGKNRKEQPRLSTSAQKQFQICTQGVISRHYWEKKTLGFEERDYAWTAHNDSWFNLVAENFI